MLSIGGNDVLAGRSDGGWYKDMDLDLPGSEAVLFGQIEDHTFSIIDAALAERPGIDVLLSSYEYPNFDVGWLTCWVYACPKREDLSRDPDNDLITNAELNQMMISVETDRQLWTQGNDRLIYDNGIGLMHYHYGDGQSGPGILPAPQSTFPFTPGGNPQLPTLRENFRIAGDPIHLDFDAYQFKLKHQMDHYFFDRFRGTPDATFFSEGGDRDGWVDVIANTTGTQGIRMGDAGVFSANNNWYGLLSFDTQSLPDNAVVTGASIYLQRSGEGSGSNPFGLEDRQPHLDLKTGVFGSSELVELADAIDAADFEDAGCFHGEADDDYYAIRIDLRPEALPFLNTTGRTQFRLYFDEADFSSNYVHFFDGSENGLTSEDVAARPASDRQIVRVEREVEQLRSDGSTEQKTISINVLEHRGLAELLGTTAPMLDVTYNLPLPLATLDAQLTDRGTTVDLSWRASHADPTVRYDIARSINGRSWTLLAERLRATTTFYADEQPPTGKVQYRIEQKSASGVVLARREWNLDRASDNVWIRFLENPTANGLRWLWKSETNTEVAATLIDGTGRELGTQHYTVSPDEVATFTRSVDLPAGLYTLRLRNGKGQIQSHRVVLQY